MGDPYDLNRFVEAQERVYDQVCAELEDGHKRGHWMWYIFPQIEGLGHSPTAVRFAISSLDEAAAYLRHPLLGPRLVDCTELVNRVTGIGIREIFGYPDYLKFRSCMTLFARAADDDAVFRTALRKYFDGEEDPMTVERLG
jgi:uncharacterized protein (DUF1810 family)